MSADLFAWPSRPAAGTRPPAAGGRTAWLPYALTVAATVGLIVGLATHSLLQQRQLYRDRTMVATQNIALLLDRNISGTFDKCDAVLQSVVLYFDELSLSGSIDSQRLNNHLAQLETTLPEVLSLRATDRDGNVKYGRAIPIMDGVNLGEREFYLRARADPNAGLVISGLLRTHQSKQWIIVLARRLEAADGSFAGIAYVSFSVNRLQKLLSSLDIGARGAAAIRGADFSLIQRFPDSGEDTGRQDVSEQFRRIVAAGQKEGRYIATSTLDEIERSSVFRALPDYPFYVSVGLATDDFLGEWRQHAWTVAGLTALVVVALCGTALLLYRNATRLAADVETRKATEAELRWLSAHTDEAIEAERMALSREVHDHVGALLTGIRMKVDRLAQKVPADAPAAHDELRHIAELCQTAQLSTRAICTRLRPPMLDDLGLIETCRWYVDDWAASSGIAAAGHFAELPLGPEIPVADLFRILQELLTNVARHSGASRVRVELFREKDTLRLCVADNGRGFAASGGSAGFGLIGIRERAARCAGQVAIASCAHGAVVTVSIPAVWPE